MYKNLKKKRKKEQGKKINDENKKTSLMKRKVAHIYGKENIEIVEFNHNAWPKFFLSGFCLPFLASPTLNFHTRLSLLLCAF